MATKKDIEAAVEQAGDGTLEEQTKTVLMIVPDADRTEVQRLLRIRMSRM